MRKLIVSAATAIAMAAAPAIASAQAAAPAASTAEIQPASEDGDGSALRKGGYILPVLLVVAIIAALYLTIDDNEQDLPISP